MNPVESVSRLITTSASVMGYPPQMRALSVLNGRLATVKPKEATRSELKRLIHTFYTRNSIHGINNFIRESTGLYERCTWLLVLGLTVMGMVYVSLILSQRYSDSQFQTVVAKTSHPIYEVVFPTVTICNNNRFNWKRIEAAKAKFLPLEKNQRKLDLFADVVAAFNGISFGKFSAFENVSDKPLQLLNEVNLTNVFTFMTWTCAEMFTDCKWREEEFNCCDKLHLQKSELGLCFAFNGVQNEESKRKEQKDPYYPLHNANYGPQSGLQVKVHIRPEDQLPNSQLAKGIIAMIHEPPVWHKDPFFIPWNTETTMEIEPVLYYYDNNTRGVSSSLRECVFDNERNSADFKSIAGYVYMNENCYSQCHQEYLIRYCNCTLDLFYPPDEFPTCQASDFQCIYQHRDYFRHTMSKGEEQYVFNRRNGMTCDCFRNCFSVNYVTEVRPSYLPANILGNSSYVDLDVHYRYDSIMVYRTGLVFGWVDLMVSFGGIAGLFLGCSLISGLEILYFLIVDIPRFIYQQVKRRRTTSKVVNLHQTWARGGFHPKERNLGIFHGDNVLGRHFK